MLTRGAVVALCLLAATGVSSGCSTTVDLKQSLEVTDVSTGWFDAGIVGGKNKLVPSVTFRLRKKADVDLSAVSLNLIFKRTGEEDEHWDDVFVQRVPFAEGQQTAPVTVRAETGYTGDPPQSRAEMLKHSQFRDMSVQIFARQSSSQWVELHKVDVQRLLLTQ
jgi:hypothetical protein